MSSTKRRCEKEKEPLIYTHLKFPTLFVAIKLLLIPLETMRKRRGDKGKPYLKPLIGLGKKSEPTPLIITEKYIVVT
jgi:hypothetical protein